MAFDLSDPDYLYIGYHNRRRYFLSRERDSWEVSFGKIKSRGNPRVNLAVIRDLATNSFVASASAAIFPQVTGYTEQHFMHIGAF